MLLRESKNRSMSREVENSITTGLNSFSFFSSFHLEERDLGIFVSFVSLSFFLFAVSVYM